MTIGDRAHLSVPPIRAGAYAPDARLGPEPLAFGLASAYSYGQQRARLAGAWSKTPFAEPVARIPGSASWLAAQDIRIPLLETERVRAVLVFGASSEGGPNIVGRVTLSGPASAVGATAPTPEDSLEIDMESLDGGHGEALFALQAEVTAEAPGLYVAELELLRVQTAAVTVYLHSIVWTVERVPAAEW